MSIKMWGIFIPYEGDVVYCDDKKHKSYGKRGKIIKSEEDMNMSHYDCGYHHTVKLDDGNTIFLTDEQVGFKNPKKLT